MAAPRLYTRKGDDGTTGLLYGGRVRKDSEAPRAYGAVDEAQAFLGLARSVAETGTQTGARLDELLVGVETDLWVLMAELATAPANRSRLTAGQTMVTAEMVSALEGLIDEVTARYEAPREFVVPGQERTAAHLDVARTVVRRAERECLSAVGPGSEVVAYLNRLSDLLFALARWSEGEATLAAREAAAANPESRSRP